MQAVCRLNASPLLGWGMLFSRYGELNLLHLSYQDCDLSKEMKGQSPYPLNALTKRVDTASGRHCGPDFNPKSINLPEETKLRGCHWLFALAGEF